MAELRIGMLAERTRTTPPTIRYYEEIGLLRTPERQAGGQRRYDERDVSRLAFIRHCRALGFSIHQVRSLVSLTQDRRRSCRDARELATAHLASVRARVHELEALARRIETLIERGDSRCAGGPAPDCVMLEDLSTPSPGRFPGPPGRSSVMSRRSAGSSRRP